MATVSLHPFFPAMPLTLACWNWPILGTSNKNTILLWGEGDGPYHLTSEDKKTKNKKI